MVPMGEPRVPSTGSSTPAGRPTSPRTRLILLLVLAIGWGGFWSFVDSGELRRDKEQRALSEFTAGDESLPWKIEHLFVVGSRVGDFESVVLRRARGDLRFGNENRLRVLVLGDSMTYGLGLSDTTARWPNLLEAELSAVFGDGNVEVVTLARPGSSLFTQRDWLAALDACRSATEGCREEFAPLAGLRFAAVVLGFTGNDLFASPMDSIVETSGIEPAPVLAFGQSPHEQFAGRTAREIKGLLGDIPVLWMPLATIEAQEQDVPNSVNWAPAAWWGHFEGAGFVRVDVRDALAAVAKSPVEDLVVSPVDPHPSSVLTKAYATDAARALLRVLPAPAGAVSLVIRDLVADALPATLAVSTSPSSAQITNPSTPPGCPSPEIAPATGLLTGWSGIPDTAYRCEEGEPLFTVSGTSFPVPSAPCVRLGKPYAQIILDHHLPAGTVVSVKLSSNADLELRPVGYDDTNVLRFGPVSKGSAGSHTFTVDGQRFRGLVVSERAGSGCAPHSADVRVPGFSLSVEVAR